MTLSHQQYAKALERVKSQTQLPDHRVREVLTTMLRQVETNPSASTMEPVERAIMLATTALWAEEKVKGLRGPR